MSEDLSISTRVTVPASELEFSFARSSGPGGQNVNKVSSKAVLRWAVAKTPSLPEEVRERFLAKYRTRITTEGELVMSCQRYRDQGRNIEECRTKLSEMIQAVLTAPRKRKATKPSKGSKERRLKEKKVQATRKQDRQTDW